MDIQQRKVSKVLYNSPSFPLFSSNRIESLSPTKKGGKQTMPDCAQGVSKEFPSCFNHDFQLTSRISLDNPYISPDFREKTINRVRQNSISGGKFLDTIAQKQNFLKTIQLDHDSKIANAKTLDMSTEKVLKGVNRILLRNTDRDNYEVNPSKQTYCLTERQVGSDTSERVQIAGDLKSSFVDYSLAEYHQANKRNYLKLPQLPIKQYDCIRDEMTITHPPDIELEGFSKYREKYYNILNNQEKPFNKKQGLFTLFTEKSKPERIMNKIYDKIKKENNGKIIFKKNQVEVLKVKEGEVQVYNEFENDDRVPLESLTSRADDSTTVKTSFTQQQLRGNKKGKYRYYNDGQFIEKKDLKLHRESMDQLQLSKQLQRKSIFGAFDPKRTSIQLQSQNFNDIESLTTYQNSSLPTNRHDSTMLKTKSLSTLFNNGTLTSLSSTLKPTEVLLPEEQMHQQHVQRIIHSLVQSQRNLNVLNTNLEGFQKNLESEKTKYKGSPPIYSPVRSNFVEKQKLKAQISSRNDSINRREGSQNQDLVFDEE